MPRLGALTGLKSIDCHKTAIVVGSHLKLQFCHLKLDIEFYFYLLYTVECVNGVVVGE